MALLLRSPFDGFALRRGARLIVIDPARVGLATKADHWLRLRPGSDGALALSFAHVLIEEQRFDAEFVRNWTNGPFLVREDDGRCVSAADLSDGGDPAVRVGGDGGDPVTVTQPDSVVSQEFASIAGRFAQRLAIQEHKALPVLQ